MEEGWDSQDPDGEDNPVLDLDSQDPDDDDNPVLSDDPAPTVFGKRWADE